MIAEHERCADMLDTAGNVTASFTADRVATASWFAAPEQDGTLTECSDCGSELGQRGLAPLFKIRCIRCQEILEKKRNGYGHE